MRFTVGSVAYPKWGSYKSFSSILIVYLHHLHFGDRIFKSVKFSSFEAPGLAWLLARVWGLARFMSEVSAKVTSMMEGFRIPHYYCIPWTSLRTLAASQNIDPAKPQTQSKSSARSWASRPKKILIIWVKWARLKLRQLSAQSLGIALLKAPFRAGHGAGR